MNGQLSYQIHDGFAVIFHLGAALLNGAIDVALNSGPRPDEDRQVVVVTVINNTGTTGCAALTANCAAVPSAVDCVVKAIGAYGVTAPMLCNILPNCEDVLTDGAVSAEQSLFSDGN